MDCTIYRCSRQDEMYLYLADGESLDELPEALRQRLGRLTEVMQLTLTPERQLARADVNAVIDALTVRGYYLQMPPADHINGHLHDGD